MSSERRAANSEQRTARSEQRAGATCCMSRNKSKKSLNRATSEWSQYTYVWMYIYIYIYIDIKASGSTRKQQGGVRNIMHSHIISTHPSIHPSNIQKTHSRRGGVGGCQCVPMASGTSRIYVDLCWFMLIFMLIYVNSCWFSLIHADLCWENLIFMLIYVDLCGYLCWFMLIYVDLAWFMLIYVDLCWFMLIKLIIP